MMKVRQLSGGGDAYAEIQALNGKSTGIAYAWCTAFCEMKTTVRS